MLNETTGEAKGKDENHEVKNKVLTGNKESRSLDYPTRIIKLLSFWIAKVFALPPSAIGRLALVKSESYSREGNVCGHLL